MGDETKDSIDIVFSKEETVKEETELKASVVDSDEEEFVDKVDTLSLEDVSKDVTDQKVFSDGKGIMRDSSGNTYLKLFIKDIERYKESKYFVEKEILPSILYIVTTVRYEEASNQIYVSNTPFQSLLSCFEFMDVNIIQMTKDATKYTTLKLTKKPELEIKRYHSCMNWRKEMETLVLDEKQSQAFTKMGIAGTFYPYTECIHEVLFNRGVRTIWKYPNNKTKIRLVKPKIVPKDDTTTTTTTATTSTSRS
jgi:hypothetical protein